MLDEMRWAEHRERVDFTPVHEFAQDQPCFNRLADTDVIGDQQARHRQAKGHQQRDELVGSGLEGKLRSRAERTGAPAQGQA
ncbi:MULTISPECIES: hypothetical protein [Acidiphilium]|uniref:hypothetical protein n=1 Tax=Acidiphilium TaxID=522 RepID=UPI00258909FE|nr:MULTISPECIES: hypothetical protein [Acidiphilium]HQT86907.1 hypothetical protein [Acidiphilium rubrum]